MDAPQQIPEMQQPVPPVEQTVPQPQQPPPSPEPMKEKPKLLWLLIIVFILIGAYAGAAYFLNLWPLQNFNFGVSVSPTPEPATTLVENYPDRGMGGDLIIDDDYIFVANANTVVKYDRKSGEQEVYHVGNGLLNNIVFGMVRYKNELWVASQSSGLSILNLDTNRWRYIRKSNDKLVSDSNLAMKLDGDILWIGAFRAFMRHDMKTGEWNSWTVADTITNLSVRDFVFNDKYVWVTAIPSARSIGGLARLDKETLQWTDLTKDNSIFGTRQMGARNSLHVEGNYFYAILSFPARSTTVYRNNLTTGKWDTFPGSLETFNKFHISLVENDGLYYKYNPGKDITVYDGDQLIKTINTSSVLAQCDNLASTFTQKTTLFFEGNKMWIGCNQGFETYDVSAGTWEFVDVLNGFPGEIGIVGGRSGDELLAITNLGIGLLDLRNQKWTFIKEVENNINLSLPITIGDDVYFIEEEFGGIGGPTNPPIMWKYNKVGNSLEKVENSQLSSGVSFHRIKKGGNKFYYTIPGPFQSVNSLTELDPITGEVRDYSYGIESLFVTDGARDGNIIWLATSKGLLKMDTSKGRADLIGNPPGLRNPTIGIGALEKVGDEIWVTTFSSLPEGVFVYNINTGLWNQLNKSNSGMMFDTMTDVIESDGILYMKSGGDVSGLEEPGDRNIILTSDTFRARREGIETYNIETGIWNFVSAGDGLMAHERSAGAGRAFIIPDIEGVWIANLVGASRINGQFLK